MRMTRTELTSVTRLVRPSAQARWFHHHFGITLPVDRYGPIITHDAYSELVRRQCGLSQATGPVRPQVRRIK